MMEMVLRNDFLEMNPMELEDVSGGVGVRDMSDIICIGPPAKTLIDKNALIGVSMVSWALTTTLSMFQK